MKSLELKIPPVLLVLGIGLAMWLVSRLTPSLDLPWFVRTGAALVLALAGLGIAVAGVLYFHQAKTTLNPTRPASASALVDGGIYRVTRNPMYLGLALLLLAWAVYLSSLPALLLLPVFILFINRLQIVPEERALASLFTDRYAAYKKRVRRWL